MCPSLLSLKCLGGSWKDELSIYRCDGGRFGAQFYLQERLLELDGCERGQWGLCDWSVIKQKYESISENCDLSFC
jgi:hypothetical protein